MDLYINKSYVKTKAEVRICGSKSESNRLLILQALFPQIRIENLSTAEDTQLLKTALSSKEKIIDIHHAGTAMRFLTAYFAVQKDREVRLTGSPRMKQRPIGVLVDALNDLGCKISYSEKEGFPPVHIIGKTINANKVSINATTSSQFVTALMLIGPSLKNGIHISLKGTITSKPYIQMTLSLLNEMGISAGMDNHIIKIDYYSENLPLKKKFFRVESDWSSASYYYSIVALSSIGTEIKLSNFKKDSLQGDSVLATIYKTLGVETIFSEEFIVLKKADIFLPKNLKQELKDTPDIAQTIAVTCFGLGISCELTGLHTLKIKETDRLFALKTELRKLGAEVETDNSSLFLNKGQLSQPKITVSVDTYNDHRMAMAFAPLAVLFSIQINDAGVVSKSYPAFWDNLQNIGFEIPASSPDKQ